MKPLLLRHYHVRYEPANGGGEEALIFSSASRRLVVNGSSFREFLDLVVPLLDGTRTLAEIEAQVAGTFARSDLAGSIDLLVKSGIVVDAEGITVPTHVRERLGPELSYFHELGVEPSGAVARLAERRVTVVGLGPVGIVAATALAAANVGRIRCVDGSTVLSADPLLGQLFGLGDVGRSRTVVAGERIESINPGTSVESAGGDLLADREIQRAIEDSDFVLCCVDPGFVSLVESLNLAALALRIPWCSGTASAFEGVVGPTVIPYQTACYRCYQERVLACSPDPVAAVADLRQIRETRTGTEQVNENLPFGAGIVGQLLALQAFQALTGLKPESEGRILVFNLLTAAMSRHVVLRKPWCPACFPSADG